jgi:hypothetical protein
MIVIKVELWSAINGRRTELARMMINNVGGDMNLRDYETRTYRGRSEATLHRAMLADTTTRRGKVVAHPAERVHVWNLVAKALFGMGYGKEN